MKTKAKTLVVLAIILTIAVAIAVLCIQVQPNIVFAEETEIVQKDEYIISDDMENIEAVYEFLKLSETECSVRIANKTVATKAIIPSSGEIDGIKYKVTEIAGSGFMNSPKLIRVSLPSTVKKIGSNAFMNCAKLMRINLANVEEIGNNAFYRCPELTEIVIPESAHKIGTYILRNNNTKVRVRANEAGENWASSWNNNNTNQDVEYGSKYVQPLELEPIYNTANAAYALTSAVRSSDEIIGYSIGGGQPRNESFYAKEYDEVQDEEYDCTFIPAQYDGLDILEIQENAFEGAYFSQLIFEYSDKALYIDGGAFANTDGENIVINRPVEYYDGAKEIFSCSFAQTIVLPNNITSIVDSMFSGCFMLSNIFFIKPQAQSRKQLSELTESLMQTEKEGTVKLPATSAIRTIGEYAFASAESIKELHMDESIQNVGYNILDGWLNNQKVFVHNRNKIKGWDKQWNNGFSNVEYDKYIYTITFNPEGGKFIGENKGYIDVELGKEIGELPEVKKDGFTFKGWQNDDGKNITNKTIYEFKKDIELKANWEKISCKVTLKPANGEEDKIVYVDYGGFLSSLEVPQKDGYVFMGYFTKEEGNGSQYYYSDMRSPNDVKITYDITLYAHWETKKYTVKLYSGYGEQKFIEAVEVHYKTKLRYAKKPDNREGYDFVGYYDGLNGNAKQYYDKDMECVAEWDKDSDGELYAHWELTVYTISYKVKEKEDVDFPTNFYLPNPDKYTIEDVQDKAIEMVPVSSAGYYITWENCVEKNSTGDVTIYGNAEAGVYMITYDFTYWNGGELVNDNPTTFTVEDEIVFNAIRINSQTSVICSPAKIEKGTCHNITVTMLVATTLSEYTSSYTASSYQYELIYLPQKFTKNCTITVVGDVNSVKIIGQSEAIYSMNLVIDSDNENFDLLLQNVIIQAPAGKHAISTGSDKALSLYTYGLVKIIGGNGVASAGYSGIYCGMLFINAASQLYVVGGVGAKGSTKTSGTGGSGSIINPTVNFGEGYAGGCAIYVAQNHIFINCGNVMIVGGKGGAGADGYNMVGGLYPGGAGGQPFGGSAQVTVHIYWVIANSVSYSVGGNGSSSTGSTLVDPSIDIGPWYPVPDPTYPINPI